MADLGDLLAEADRAVDSRWPGLEEWLRVRFGREAALEPILFLMGVQSRGAGYTPQLDKDAKQDLIMEGTFVALGELGFYDRVEDDGTRAWNGRVELPQLTVAQQESLLKLGILRYFEQFMDTP